jgi:hypothetical protein
MHEQQLQWIEGSHRLDITYDGFCNLVINKFHQEGIPFEMMTRTQYWSKPRSNQQFSNLYSKY